MAIVMGLISTGRRSLQRGLTRRRVRSCGRGVAPAHREGVRRFLARFDGPGLSRPDPCRRDLLDQAVLVLAPLSLRLRAFPSSGSG